jgi:lipopolysaccharide/colanic/teichoic acid biosynthesis glycosyltransferase
MKTRRLEIWIWLADLAWIGVAFVSADLLRYGLSWSAAERASIHALMPFAAATAIAWSALSAFMPIDGFRGGWRLSAVLSELLLGLGSMLAVLTVLGYFSRSYVSRLALSYFILLLGLGFLGVRCGARSLLRRRSAEGGEWRVLILGCGRIAQEVAAKIEQHPEMLAKVVGFLFPSRDSSEIAPQVRARASELSTLDTFDLLRRLRIDEIILTLPHPFTAEIRTMIARARDMGIAISLVPQPYELYAYKPRLVSLDGLPLVGLREPGLRQTYVLLKRALDLSLAILFLLPAALVILPVACFLLVKKGAAFYAEERMGQHGVPFSMWRLAIPRPVGNGSAFERLLDRLSIPELPQLWNVIRGQMSLVGPRPESRLRSSRYSEWEERRLRVKPGISGHAQVHGLREHSSLEQKTRFDLQYVMNPHLLWDLSLLLQTVWTLAMRLARAQSRPKIYELNWPREDEAGREIVSHAHRTQPSAD